MSTDALTDPLTGSPDEPEAPAAPVQPEVPEGEDKPTPELPWLDGADDDTLEYVKGKGWKDPATAIKSAREAERVMRQAEARAEAAERRQQQITEALQAAAGAGRGVPEQQDPYQIAQVAEAMEQGEISMAQGMQYLFSQVVPHMANEVAQRAVQPVQTYQQTGELERTAQELASTYEDFNELSDEVLKMIEQDPHQFNSPRGMKAAYGLARAEKDRRMAAQRQRTQRAETIDRGSLGQSVKPAHDAIRDAIEKARPRHDDGL